MTPHKHAELIKAWADGAIIQYYDGKWQDCYRNDPAWSLDRDYRIKPVEYLYRTGDYVVTENWEVFKIEERFTEESNNYYQLVNPLRSEVLVEGFILDTLKAFCEE